LGGVALVLNSAGGAGYSRHEPPKIHPTGCRRHQRGFDRCQINER
jgi:hypothetical protein